MAAFRPFRGFMYNPSVVGDLATVVCPPYDLITPELQESLRNQSRYNVVHLEAGEGLDWNAPAPDHYSDTAERFDDWVHRGILQRDPEPCFYVVRHVYPFQGQRRTRLGLTGCVGLEEYQARIVFPHEYTEEPAILDRVALMEACNANFSPIMSLYRDSANYLSVELAEAVKGEPVIDIRTGGDQALTMWRISDPAVQERIQRFFTDTGIFLADGHHRYEAALRFRRNESLGSQAREDSSAAQNFVMMTLIEFDDPGLMVLPYHRVVGGLSPAQLAKLQERLNQVFEVNPTAPAIPGAAERLLEQVADFGEERRALGMVEADGDRSSLLTLRERADQGDWGPLAVSEAWILEEQVLKPVLGEAAAEHVTYAHDHESAAEQVSSGQRQIAFLLKPFPMAQFEGIVSQGQRLPPKSTFFYPKLPTGLVINKLDGAL